MTPTSKGFATILAVFGVLGLALTAMANEPGAQGRAKAPEYAGAPFDKTNALQQRAEVHARLMSESVDRGQGPRIRADLTAVEIAEIDSAPRGGRPERVGLTKAVSASVDFGDLSPGQLKGGKLQRNHGAMAAAADGGYVYTSTVSSPGATALRVHFTNFRVPANASVYLYTDNGQVFGPYTGRGPHGDGEFWSHTVMGDTAHVQLRHKGAVSADDLRGTGFKVAGVGHVRPRWLGFCSGNASCVENANCNNPDPAVNDARDAVAHMQWVSRGYIYICTGGLVADTDSSSQIPYFLSANHCISRGNDARNLETFFQFQEPCGTSGNCDDVIDTRNNHPQSLRVLGASIVSTGRATDHTLFELNEDAPLGSAFLGWNANDVAYANGIDLFRISHPGGAPQAYSEHTVDTSAGVCTSWPRGDRIYSRDVFGATEGGSSGSPVVNSAGEIVGQLSGACGTNVNDNCDSVSNATVDGAFAAYFSEVAQFLDPGSSCVATEPSEQSCSDGIDNDCDGAVDGNDGDCGGSGGLPVGASCTVDAECASNKCKGRAGAKTCK